MPVKRLSIPEDSLVSMLKMLPENILLNLFWKTLVKSDISPLKRAEKKDIRKAKDEFRKGKTIIKWEDLR